MTLENQSLFLGGGGDPEESKILDEAFFSSFEAKARLLYIPVAWTSSGYDSCLEWFSGISSTYRSENAKCFDMWTDNDEPTIDFDNYSAIYIGGGNTYKLLNFVVERKLKNKFKTFVARGGKIFGGSAGAIIFGKEIATVLEEKKFYPDNTGLDMCEGYSLRCHYSESEDKLYQDLSLERSNIVLGLPENSGVILDKHLKIIKIVGNVVSFKDGKKSRFFTKI